LKIAKAAAYIAGNLSKVTVGANPDSGMEDKAMVVHKSRRIGVELYKAIAALRSGWDHDDDAEWLYQNRYDGVRRGSCGMAPLHS
jgi:hypothetical protein